VVHDSLVFGMSLFKANKPKNGEVEDEDEPPVWGGTFSGNIYGSPDAD
jgi:hypothetical protein